MLVHFVAMCAVLCDRLKVAASCCVKIEKACRHSIAMPASIFLGTRPERSHRRTHRPRHNLDPRTYRARMVTVKTGDGGSALDDCSAASPRNAGGNPCSCLCTIGAYPGRSLSLGAPWGRVRRGPLALFATIGIVPRYERLRSWRRMLRSADRPCRHLARRKHFGGDNDFVIAK